MAKDNKPLETKHQLTRKEIEEIALGYEENGAQFYAEKFSINKPTISGVIAGLRRAGLKIPKRNRSKMYVDIAAGLKAKFGQK